MKHFKISHIGYLEFDHSKALKTWTDLGYKVLFKNKHDPNLNVKCSILKKKNHLNVEIVSVYNKKKKSTIDARLKKGIHFDHVCYLVPDIDLEINKQKKNNYRLIYKNYSPIFETKIAFLFSINGVLIELMQIS